MPVPQGSPGDRLLDALGYRVRWTSWVLALPEGAEIDEHAPSGYTMTEAAEEDLRSVWTVIEDAFLEWSVRERQSFEDFLAQVVRRPGYEPWNLRVAVDDSGSVVGAAYVFLSDDVAFVEKVAVRHDRRGLGLTSPPRQRLRPSPGARRSQIGVVHGLPNRSTRTL